MVNWVKTGSGGLVGAMLGFGIGYNIIRMKDQENAKCCYEAKTELECQTAIEKGCICAWAGETCAPPPHITNYLMYYGIPGAIIGGIIGTFIGSRL